MPKYVCIINSLLGDLLFCEPALSALRKSINPEDTIDVITNEDKHNQVLANNPNFKWTVVKEDQMQALKKKYATATGKLVDYPNMKVCIMDISTAFQWCYAHPIIKKGPTVTTNSEGLRRFKEVPKIISVPPHFAYAFAVQLGVHIDSPHYKVYLTDYEWEEVLGGYAWNPPNKKRVLVGSVSKSCTSRSTKIGEENLKPNKMISSKIWQEVVDYFKDTIAFTFVAAPNEERLLIDNVSWMHFDSIRDLAVECRIVSCVVGIDSGVGHLAAAVDANLISIFAAVDSTLVWTGHGSGKFIGIDHSQAQTINPHGISTVTSKEIIFSISQMLGML